MHDKEELEDTKWVIKTRKAKKDRLHNGKKKKKNKNYQESHSKNKDRATRT